jgi:transcriptional regulator with XRE-family HTH domain
MSYALLDELVDIRYQGRMTQQVVADRMGISRAAVNRIENAARQKRSPSLATLARYAQAIGAEIHATPTEKAQP